MNKFDNDVFRRDLEIYTEAYEEILKRLGEFSHVIIVKAMYIKRKQY